MKDKHDFKAALSGVNYLLTQQTCIGNLSPDDMAAIQYALRLAERLQSGEVSEEMIKDGHDEMLLATLEGNVSGDNRPIIKAFKAMAAQMIKEIK